MVHPQRLGQPRRPPLPRRRPLRHPPRDRAPPQLRLRPPLLPRRRARRASRDASRSTRCSTASPTGRSTGTGPSARTRRPCAAGRSSRSSPVIRTDRAPVALRLPCSRARAGGLQQQRRIHEVEPAADNPAARPHDDDRARRAARVRRPHGRLGAARPRLRQLAGGDGLDHRREQRRPARRRPGRCR